MQVLNEVRRQIRSVLQLDDNFDEADSETRLLGEIPELDSMAIVSLLTALEEVFEIEFFDDDISGEDFETLGTVAKMVERRLQE